MITDIDNVMAIRRAKAQWADPGETIMVEISRSDIDYIKVGLMIDREMTMSAFGRRYMETTSAESFKRYLHGRYERTLKAIENLIERFERL